jgi:C4-dicarboxylate transporter, DctM subunit
MGQRSSALRYPMGYAYAALPVGGALLLLYAIENVCARSAPLLSPRPAAPGECVIALVLVFLGLLVIGAPIAFALGLAAVVYVTVETQLPLMIVFQRMFTSLDSFPFMAIPFFILAGALMNASGLADQIIKFSRAIVGHLAGGLSNVSIVASMLFGGVSGSAIADSSALGSILIPAMNKEGYHARFSAAINATSSTMGIIIPPSIPMILAGVATNLSIRDLFFGGLVPGVMVGCGAA